MTKRKKAREWWCVAIGEEIFTFSKRRKDAIELYIMHGYRAEADIIKVREVTRRKRR